MVTLRPSLVQGLLERCQSVRVLRVTSIPHLIYRELHYGVDRRFAFIGFIHRWHQGQSLSSILRTLQLVRKTVRRYVQSARLARIDPEQTSCEQV